MGRAIILFDDFRHFTVVFSSISRKKCSPFLLKISDMDKSIFCSINLSISKKLSLIFFDKILPIVDLPDPIMPIKTRFFFILSFYIEKTQICLILKLINVICNYIKKQVLVNQTF